MRISALVTLVNKHRLQKTNESMVMNSDSRNVKQKNTINLSWWVLFFIFLFACNSETIRERPSQVSNWSKLGPGGGGSTFLPTFSYHKEDEFLIRCDMTGSYLTKDGGDSYSQVNFANGSSSFAFDPHDANTIYIGSTALNRSTDGGKTWKQIFPNSSEILSEKYEGDHASYSFKTVPTSVYNADSRRISGIRVDPVKKDLLYFSMGNAFYFSDERGGGFNRMDLQYPIAFLYTNPGILKGQVLIFTTHAIYTFNKNSKAITEKNLPSSMSPAFSFTGGTVKNSSQVILYALHNDQSKPIEEEFGYSELWTSLDHGVTWEQTANKIINNDRFKIKPSYSMVSCSEFDASHAYIVCNRYEEKADNKSIHWYGALKTDDSGNNWNWVWKGGGGSGQYGVRDGIGVSNLEDAWTEKAFGGEYIRLIDAGVSAHDGNVAVVTDWYRTMKTTNGGKTWREVYSKAQADGSFVTRGMDVTTAYGIHFDPFDSNHMAISYTDIGYHHSFNRGKSWSRSMEGIPVSWQNTCYWVVFDPTVKNKVWSAWSNLHDFPRGKMTRSPTWKGKARGGVCVSVDGGKTWKVSNNGMTDSAATTSLVLDLDSPPGNRILYAGVYNKGVFKSTDDGKTWTLKNKGLEDNACAFEITRTTNGTLFLVVSPTPVHKDGEPGREFYPGGVYKSTDNAETWTRIKISDNVIFPNGVDYDPENPDRIYLACWSSISLGDLVGGTIARSGDGDNMLESEGGIFMSEDNGKTWASIFDRNHYVYDVTVDPYHRGRVYCNTFNRAAYRSDNYGKNWQKLKDYDFHWGQRVIVDHNNPEKVFLTTFGSSVWHGTPVVE
jgi:photosystem II stability/assembly factor-like uncharacterized protein